MSSVQTQLHSKFKYSLEYFSSIAVAFFCVIFALWTIQSNGATIFGLPWKDLSEVTKYTSPLLLFLSFTIARRFASFYCEGLINNAISITLPDTRSIIVLILAAFMIMISGSFESKYYFFVIGASLIFLLSRGKSNSTREVKQIKSLITDRKNAASLLVIIFIAVSVVLFTHRSDLDDSSFIQIATQTLANSNRAPLSFDSSLGYILESFRFAPYRVSSYETFVAFVCDFLHISIYSTYYLLFPAITATLTVLTAFIFSRWFFPSNTLAVVATAIFMIVMLAWGETHFAYGNRVFVRLFQGKGLIIALTTPFAVLAGLMLTNRPSYYVAGILALANICAIGASSSGLIMTIFTSIIVLVLAINRDFKVVARTWALVAAAMIYPVTLAAWLKFGNKSLLSMSDIGTYLPINASLGLSMRESALMIGLLLGFLLFIRGPNKSYPLIITAIFSFIISPWFSEIVSSMTSRNMSWRLAWAAPLPLLFSVALASGFGLKMQTKPLTLNNKIFYFGIKIAIISLFLVFIFSYRWVSSSDNNLSWRFPAAKLPNEFYVTSEIADKIRTLDTSGQVLAHRDIAAWLPLTLPNVRLVMPGHTYPIQLQTILPKYEFDSRMALFNEINGGAIGSAVFSKLISELNVTLIIIPIGMERGLSASLLESSSNSVRLEKIESISGYSLYKVFHKN